MASLTNRTKKALDQRRFALNLYKAILRSHRNMPTEMRVIGDEYVREEFRLHKDAKPEHLQPFFSSWVNYLNDLTAIAPPKNQTEALERDWGKDLSEEDFAKMSEPQLEKVWELRDEAERLFAEAEEQNDG